MKVGTTILIVKIAIFEMLSNFEDEME
jgi:hypothetical protein